MGRRGYSCGICEAPKEPAICVDCLNHGLSQQYKLLRRLVQERESRKLRVKAGIQATREAQKQQQWRIEHTERVKKLNRHLHQSERLLVQKKLRRDERRKDLEASTNRLCAASTQLAARRAELISRYYPDVNREHQMNLAALNTELDHCRKHVFLALCKIFPLSISPAGDSVEGVSKGKNSIQLSNKHVRICGAPLPLRDDPHSVAPVELSASLGYMVQLVHQLVRYISAPILHHAVFAASSSRIWQRASYWEPHPSSRSEELPLFLPRKGTRAWESMDGSLKQTNLGGSEFLEVEKPVSVLLRSKSGGGCSGDADKEVKQAIRLLKRSISCICAYGFSILGIPMPSNLSTFEALMELLSILSMKDRKKRLNVGNVRMDGSLLQSGFVSHIQDSEFALSQMRKSKCNPVASDVFCADSNNNRVESVFVDEWDVIDHPILPPPSHSEDVEHWTRAMFLDAKK